MSQFKNAQEKVEEIKNNLSDMLDDVNIPFLDDSTEKIDDNQQEEQNAHPNFEEEEILPDYNN